MRRSDSTATSWLGLALVDPLAFDPALLEALQDAKVSATFFVRPDVLILDNSRWRFVLAAGHELGNGCLLGVTDDGRLPNWTYATLDLELRESEKLLAELGQTEAAPLYLPGRFHVCADGRYRRRLQGSYDVCIGDSDRSASLMGVCGAFGLCSSPYLPTELLSVVRLKPDPTELLAFLEEADCPQVGRVGELAKRSPHT